MEQNKILVLRAHCFMDVCAIGLQGQAALKMLPCDLCWRGRNIADDAHAFLLLLNRMFGNPGSAGTCSGSERLEQGLSLFPFAKPAGPVDMAVRSGNDAAGSPLASA